MCSTFQVILHIYPFKPGLAQMLTLPADHTGFICAADELVSMTTITDEIDVTNKTAELEETILIRHRESTRKSPHKNIRTVKKKRLHDNHIDTGIVLTRQSRVKGHMWRDLRVLPFLLVQNRILMSVHTSPDPVLSWAGPVQPSPVLLQM